jgi:hypothetical protein
MFRWRRFFLGAPGPGSLVMINEGPEFSVDSTADLTLGDGFIELSDGTILPIVGEADCG